MTLAFPSANFNFASKVIHPALTFARADAATCATYFGADGLLKTAVANQARFDYQINTGLFLGLLMEPARTNGCLRSRDLSNASWTKSNITAVKDQTGIDGSANSASSLLATAANGTCSQAITSASNARRFSAYVKRITGSGAISMSLDGGSTYTAITSLINSTTWTRVAIGQTNTDPTVVFKIATDTDKIAVDCVQEEVGTFDTSAIVTAGSTVTRAAETLTWLPAGPVYNSTQCTILAEYSVPDTTFVDNRFVWYLDATNDAQLRATLAASAAEPWTESSTFAQFATTVANVANQSRRVAFSLKSGAQASSGDGATAVTGTATVDLTPTLFYIGSNSGSASQLGGHITLIQVYSQYLSQFDIQALTLPPVRRIT